MWILVFYCCVMEYGKLRRIYVIVLIGAISEILEYKTIEAYWTYSDRWLQCSECDPVASIGNPIDIWDSFPCPPKSEPEIFLELDWIGKLGAIDGETIRQRVAKRCDISITSSSGPRPADYAESSLFIENCDINCILVVLAILVCSVVLAIPAVLCCLKRRNVCKWFTKKTLNRHSTTTDPPFYGDHFYPPLNSSVTRDSEIVYNTDGAQSRLLHPERTKQTTVSPYRYYEKVYNDKDPQEPDLDLNPNQKNSSEETSLTYSGTDTTHTYESLKDSQRSASFRLSNTSGTSAQNQNVSDRADQQYNSSLASSSQGQRHCACPRCSRTNIYRPYESIDYNTTYNVYPQKFTYPYNRFQQYRIPSPPMGGTNDKESEALRNPKQNLVGTIPDDTSYIEEPAPPERMRKDRSFYDSDQNEGSVNSDYQIRRNKCNCRKCSQTNLNNSNLTSPTNMSDSEFYGVPDQMTINMVPLRPCNCRHCSQNNLGQMKYDYPSYYNQRHPCTCKRCLQNIQHINPTIETYFYDPNSSEREHSGRKQTKSKSEDKKRKKNKSERPLSSHASSTDTNTGSEKSYRMGVPKTNGSLYRSKLSKA
ncbi:unnamed protein product [Mytilus edulis]|uniref:Uncharacterized protein n=1 Tax=Mytilus edulis TaxID=6550 RepID=A0A8S3VNI1_MYTED|nr:unnamed protein product [Mytilus edulis]